MANSLIHKVHTAYANVASVKTIIFSEKGMIKGSESLDVACTKNSSENKSILCLEFDNENDCFPCHSALLSNIVGIWCGINAIFGSFGNFVTFLTISYGLRKSM